MEKTWMERKAKMQEETEEERDVLLKTEEEEPDKCEMGKEKRRGISENEELKLRYKRGMNHYYLVADVTEEQETDYQLRMVLENEIQGLLHVEERLCEGRNTLYFEISSLQPMERLYDHRELLCEDVAHIVNSILDCFEKLEDYMLEDTHILLDPAYIYMEPDSLDVKLIYYPGREFKDEQGFLGLAEYFMEKISHRDAEGAMYAYRLYQLVKRGNYVPADIRALYGSMQKEGVGAQEGSCAKVFRTECHEKDSVGGGSEKKRDLRQEICAEEEVPEKIKGLSNYTTEGKGAVTSSDIWSCGNPMKAARTDEEEREEKRTMVKKRNGMIAIFLILAGVVIMLALKGNKAKDVVAFSLIVVGVLIPLLGNRKKQKTEAPALTDGKWEKVQKENASSRIMELCGTDDFGELFSDVQAEHTEKRKEDNVSEKAAEEYGKTVFMEREETELENILREKGKNKEYPMDHFPFTIGKVRECVDLALRDSSVSRIHARILQEGGKLYLQDCHSTNGTYLNGVLLEAEEKVPIEREDEIGIGRLRFGLF